MGTLQKIETSFSNLKNGTLTECIYDFKNFSKNLTLTVAEMQQSPSVEETDSKEENFA